MEKVLTQPMAEVLETVWTLEERGGSQVDEVRREAATAVDDNLLDSLSRNRMIEIDSGKVKLLPEGRDRAEKIIRQHRLAERLVVDVLGVHVDDSEDAACEFEHVVAPGVVSSICTLLGHPRFCPHNRAIPEGECCRQAREELKPIVAGCDTLRPGETARIAYICAREHSLTHKLAALGIAPGAQVRLLQKWPSYVLLCDETEVALETELAKNIYVWCSGGKP
jgi:DtxR family transcriptional regulator, Mn-dependent transcriptional regulator